MTEIETAAAKLLQLAGKPSLSNAENAEAQAAMQSLKASGMSNVEIANICKGRWSVSTIKGYTKGINAPSPNPWQDAVSMLTDAIVAHITMDDITTTLEVKDTLEANKITLEDITEFLKAVAAVGLDLAQLIDEVQALRKSGLSLQDAVVINALKTKMESHGLSLEALPALAKIAQQYDDPQQALEAFSQYPSLTALQAEITAAQEQLEKIQVAQAAASQQLHQTEDKSQQMQAPIKAYEAVLEYGFDEKALVVLSGLTSKYGGPKTIFKAIEKYTSLEEIINEVTAAKSELAAYNSKVSQAITKHGHLITAIKMCETLIADHQYGLDAIGTILTVAKKFGEPVAVLKAIETYGNLKALETRLSAIKGTVAEREKLLASLEWQFKEVQEKLDGLHAMALHIGDEAGRLEGQFKASENLQRLLAIINSPENAAYAKHGQIISMLAISLRKWVTANETKFKWSNDIKAGLKYLVEELGGLV
jgi:predicted nuclease with TOPRIM domain